jgi:hypothetical protein
LGANHCLERLDTRLAAQDYGVDTRRLADRAFCLVIKMNRALDRLGDDRDAPELIDIALALQASGGPSSGSSPRRRSFTEASAVHTHAWVGLLVSV